MAFPAIAALAAGGAATVGTVLAAVAEVGMAMTVVGTVTGSKSLMKIGGVMSLVGGVGGALAGAAGGASSAASSLAEAGADAATSSAWSQGAGLGGDTLSGMGMDSAATGAMDTGGGITSSAQNAPVLEGAMPDASMAMNPTDMALQAGTKATPQGQMPMQTSAPTVNDIQSVNTPASKTVSTPFDKSVSTPADTGSLTAPQSSGSFFDKFSKFAEGNKTLFNSGMQLVGGALKGANDSAQFKTRADLEQQRINQTKYGNTTSKWQPRTGIIAGAQAQ